MLFGGQFQNGDIYGLRVYLNDKRLRIAVEARPLIIRRSGFIIGIVIILRVWPRQKSATAMVN